MILKEIKEKFDGLSFTPFIIFFLLAILLFWVRYPVGVYDLSEDQWVRGNDIAGYMWKYTGERYDFNYDPVMLENKKLTPNTIALIQLPFVKLFNGYERYKMFLSIFLFFAGSSLLFMVSYLLTRSNIISFFSSLLFSSSSIWFQTGGIFSFIHIHGALPRTIAHVWFFVPLLMILSLKITPLRLYILIFITTVVVWIKQIVFLGPAIALIIVAYFSVVLSDKYNLRQKLNITILSTMTMTVLFFPYVFIFCTSINPAIATQIPVELNDAMANMLNQRKPFSKAAYFIRHCLSEFLPFYLPLATFFIIKGNRNVKILTALAFVCFFFNLFLQEIDYLMGYKFHLYHLVRNGKWLYFILFLLSLASYPNLKKIVLGDNRRRSVVLSAIFCFMLFVFFAPHIKRSITSGSMPSKIAKRIGICGDVDNNKKVSYLYPINKFLKYCPDDNIITALKINEDADDITSFMLTMPHNLTFIGPSWLRYKAGRNLSFNTMEGDLRFYIRNIDVRYLELINQTKTYQKFIKGAFAKEMDSSNFLNGMRSVGGRFLFIEKFQIKHDNDYWNSFHKKKIVLENLPVAYENDSFAIIDLK